MRERELKLLNEGRQVILDVSLPMRERELKPRCRWYRAYQKTSLPMRERELKLRGTGEEMVKPCRSPCGSAN